MIIKYDVSNEMQDLINKTIESDAAKKGFGVIPTQKQFLIGVIYYWIRKNIPDIIDDISQIEEIMAVSYTHLTLPTILPV